MTTHPTLRDVLYALAPGNTMAPEAEARVRAAVAPLGARTPWYVRALIGGGAWFGTWFLLAFLFALLGMAFGGDIAMPALVVGGPLVALAIALHRMQAGDFTRQLALVVSLTGQGIFIAGLAALTNSDELAAVAALALSAVMLAVYPDRVHRFFSTIIAAGALLALIHDARLPYGVELLALALIAIPIALWRVVSVERRAEYAGLIDPVVAGTIVSLLGLLLLTTLVALSSWTRSAWLTTGALTAIGVTIALLLLAQSLFAEHHVPLSRPEPVASFVAILLLAAVTWTTPAILATLLVLILGFDRRNRVIVGLAIAFFLAFGAFYYYSLELTLLQKAGVLAASGAVCLAAATALRSHTATEAA